MSTLFMQILIHQLFVWVLFAISCDIGDSKNKLELVSLKLEMTLLLSIQCKTHHRVPILGIRFAMLIWNIEIKTKWPPIFKLLAANEYACHLICIPLKFVPSPPILKIKWALIGWNNDLTPRQQAIILTNHSLVYGYIYVSLGLNDLNTQHDQTF